MRSIEGGHDFILCNYANGDMVGHSGSMPATIKAVETVDQCLARVLASPQRPARGCSMTADHGNCEMMIDPATGGPHTAHTTNPVPFVVVDGRRGHRPCGAAARCATSARRCCRCSASSSRRGDDGGGPASGQRLSARVHCTGGGPSVGPTGTITAVLAGAVPVAAAGMIAGRPSGTRPVYHPQLTSICPAIQCL